MNQEDEKPSQTIDSAPLQPILALCSKQKKKLFNLSSRKCLSTRRKKITIRAPNTVTLTHLNPTRVYHHATNLQLIAICVLSIYLFIYCQLWSVRCENKKGVLE